MRLALLVLITISCHGTPVPPPPIAATSASSNILRADYAGSTACADCHAQVYKSWEHSPMRNMTRDAKTATIRAPFDGTTLQVGTDTCEMITDGGGRAMRVTTKTGKQTWHVTKVVGGRYREDFVGVADGESVEHVLPATYVFSTQSWRYKGYSVMVKERPYMSVRGQWSQECIGCHNTLPLSTMLYDELYGPGLPSYQGKLSDRVLPKSRSWGAVARDEDGLVQWLASEILFLGDRPPTGGALKPALAAAATTSEQKLDGEHLVELGIGCEACHNGAKLHARAPEVKPAFEARSSLLDVTPPKGQSGTRAQWINHTCAKCHTVLFTKYPWTWEGGVRSKDPGGSSISSGEGRDYQLGGCASEMTCTTCHDPHAADAKAKLEAMATPAGDATCMTCHAKVAPHSHHSSVGCVGCHMPKKNMGLDYGMIRYHRIGSPTDKKRVERDRPLECALCHADKSVESIVTTMESWYGKQFDRAMLRALYGADLSVNALRATLTLGKPHEQAAAIAVYGETKDREAVPAIVPMLAHEYPLVRYFAQRALQRITGDPVAIDVGRTAAQVRAAADVWLRGVSIHR